MPTLILIAGPNGAGKTTFAKEFLPNEASCMRFLNADEIARGLSPLDPNAAAIHAGRLLLSEFQRLLQKRADFALESTLSGKPTSAISRKQKRSATRSNFITFGFQIPPNPSLASNNASAKAATMCPASTFAAVFTAACNICSTHTSPSPTVGSFGTIGYPRQSPWQTISPTVFFNSPH
jgi:hypothetical protein